MAFLFHNNYCSYFQTPGYNVECDGLCSRSNKSLLWKSSEIRIKVKIMESRCHLCHFFLRKLPPIFKLCMPNEGEGNPLRSKSANLTRKVKVAKQCSFWCCKITGLEGIHHYVRFSRFYWHFLANLVYSGVYYSYIVSGPNFEFRKVGTYFKS